MLVRVVESKVQEEEERAHRKLERIIFGAGAAAALIGSVLALALG